MSGQLGLGVMIQTLGGNRETVEAIEEAKGRRIQNIRMDDDIGEDGGVEITFESGAKLTIRDAGRSCCESRYIRTDDNLDDFVGARFLSVETADGGATEEDYEEHEIQFLRIHTDKGIIVFLNHNEHNGYYGGFWMTASFAPPVPSASDSTTAQPSTKNES